MDKVYLITGASSDIGMAYIRKLEMKREECTVLGQYKKNEQRLKNFADACNYVNLVPGCCDLSNPTMVREWISQIGEGGYKPTHILHLAANKFGYMRLKNFDWEKTKLELEIQVHSIAAVLKTFLPQMAREKYGKIVFLLSAYTIGVPPKFMSDYILTKYALWGLMKSAASEYSGKGIQINGLSPNMIETQFLSNLDPRTIEMNALNSAMSRNVSVNEVVDGIDFLLSDCADYINGINLNMTGGDRM